MVHGMDDNGTDYAGFKAHAKVEFTSSGNRNRSRPVSEAAKSRSFQGFPIF
jgi:hypothetical protein